MLDFTHSEEENEDFNFAGKKENFLEGQQDFRKLPVFIQASEVLEIIKAIAAVIDRDKDVMRLHEQLLTNAYMIPAKIVGAEAGDLYSIRMDNATLVKLSSREIQSVVLSMKEEKLVPSIYLELLLVEMEKFRMLFLRWVRSFDKSNDILDEWDISF